MKKFFLLFFTLIVFIFTLSACKIQNKTDLNQKTDQLEDNLDAKKLWDKCIRFFCETDCDDFDNPLNLDKQQILEICQYYKILSSSNLEYDEELDKYIISEIEVSEIVRDLLGIENFKLTDNNFYDNDKGIYFFDEYIGFFDDEDYEDMSIIKLDDKRIEFIITVIDGKTKNKKEEHYILKKNENKQSDYYIVSKETKKISN